jgi:hypothetical protein
MKRVLLKNLDFTQGSPADGPPCCTEELVELNRDGRNDNRKWFNWNLQMHCAQGLHSPASYHMFTFVDFWIQVFELIIVIRIFDYAPCHNNI